MKFLSLSSLFLINDLFVKLNCTEDQNIKLHSISAAISLGHLFVAGLVSSWGGRGVGKLPTLFFFYRSDPTASLLFFLHRMVYFFFLKPFWISHRDRDTLLDCICNSVCWPPDVVTNSQAQIGLEQTGLQEVVKYKNKLRMLHSRIHLSSLDIPSSLYDILIFNTKNLYLKTV